MNGLQGVVKSLNNVEAVVSCEDDTQVTIQPVLFHVYDVYGKIIATRHQLPITLAYALTVHKAQGLTIAKHLIIDAMNMDMPGQLAVAIGRGQKKERISIINLETCTPTKHPDFILEQYKGMYSSPVATRTFKITNEKCWLKFAIQVALISSY